MTFLSETETAINTGFATVASTFGGALLDTFRPAFVIGFTIWITLIAYEVAFGKSEDGFTYLFTKIGKMFLIGTLALWGWPEVAELLNGVKDGFVGAGAISGILETKLILPMEAMWHSLWGWVAVALQPYGFGDLTTILFIGFVFLNVLVAYGCMVILVAAFGVAALAMFMVANSIFILLLAIGPVFLLCLAFPFLQRFFETFIGSVMTAILGMAFTALMVFFVANLFGLDNISNSVPTTDIDANSFSRFAKSVAVLFAAKAGTALLILYLYFKIFDLASALGGGLNMGGNIMRGVRNLMQVASAGGRGQSKSNGSSGANAGNSIGQGGGAVARAGRSSLAIAKTGSANLAQVAGAGVGRLAGAASNAGRFAYNRFAQTQNQIRPGN